MRRNRFDDSPRYKIDRGPTRRTNGQYSRRSGNLTAAEYGGPVFHFGRQDVGHAMTDVS